MNRHQFEKAAKQFRAGRITLEQFSGQMFAGSSTSDSTKKQDQSSDGAPLPSRADEAHKGDFGRVLVVGGSRDMGGAIVLSGMAALRSGSGLVVIATPASQQSQVAAFSPCYMTLGLPDAKGRISKDAFAPLVDKCEWADVVAIGPGMGQSKALQKMMELLYAQLPQPMVIDADGLNNLAKGGADLAVHEGMRVLTPHPGEFQRLDGLSDTTDRARLETRATELAEQANVTIVLKGHRTLVTHRQHHHHNNTGNPGMATAGAGDVLTGVIASLIGQGMSPYDAAVLGVRLHGTAGDLAAKELGQASLIATDILDYLPRAFETARG